VAGLAVNQAPVIPADGQGLFEGQDLVALEDGQAGPGHPLVPAAAAQRGPIGVHGLAGPEDLQVNQRRVIADQGR
jgi:hypothetical protein